jgi:fructosamine-3-kinase
MNQTLVEAIGQLHLPRAVRSTSLSGGCMHDVCRVELAEGSAIVCKRARGERGGDMLRGERVSLEAISATRTLSTPDVIGLCDVADEHVLVTAWLEPGAHGDWARFGRSLGALHCTPIESRWGFSSDTWLGGFRQPNRPMDDWHAFLRTARLEPQVQRAVDAGVLSNATRRMLESMLDRLETLVPVPARASLVHGDLWSGNCHVMADGTIAALDPAVWIGDAWADIAMATLFGGVPESMRAAWTEVVGDTDGSTERMAVHQLYHLLNHLNLFGTSYLSRVEAAVRVLR